MATVVLPRRWQPFAGRLRRRGGGQRHAARCGATVGALAAAGGFSSITAVRPEIPPPLHGQIPTRPRHPRSSVQPVVAASTTAFLAQGPAASLSSQPSAGWALTIRASMITTGGQCCDQRGGTGVLNFTAISWPLAGVMAVCNVAGSALGARVALQARIRSNPSCFNRNGGADLSGVRYRLMFHETPRPGCFM